MPIGAVIRLLELADEVHVPAGALAEAWRNAARQDRLARVISANGVTIDPLDADNAQAAGQLCGATGTTDIVDPSVVVLTRAVGGVVLTSDPDDMRNLDPAVNVVAC